MRSEVRFRLALAFSLFFSIAWPLAIEFGPPDSECFLGDCARSSWLFLVPFTVIPFLFGIVVGHGFPTPRTRFPLPRWLKLAGGLSTGGAAGVTMAVAVMATVSDSDTDKTAMIFFFLVLAVVGTVLGYGIVALGSHYRGRSKGDSPVSADD